MDGHLHYAFRFMNFVKETHENIHAEINSRTGYYSLPKYFIVSPPFRN